jgi:hypothetical protein
MQHITMANQMIMTDNTGSMHDMSDMGKKAQELMPCHVNQVL